MPDAMQIIDDWGKNPTRRVLVIDEIRDPQPNVGEVVVFCNICMTAGHVLNVLQEAAEIRSDLPSHLKAAQVKGSKLMGNRKKPAYGQFLNYFLKAMRSAERVAFVTATSKHLKDRGWVGTTGITPSADSDGDQSANRITGVELGLLIHFIKKVANDLGAGSEQIDVVVDRSAKLGLDPNQRSLVTGKFEVLGPNTFNQAKDGQPTLLQCAASFRIIASSDDGSFKDLLLLPDAAGYLGRSTGAFAQPIKDAANGNPFHVWYADFTR